MLRRIMELVRRRNRARLERRQLARSRGAGSGGWLSRLTAGLRATNHARLARRRAERSLPASLVANDTALLEAMVFLVRTARQEQRARSDAQVALDARLGALEEQVDAAVRLLAARVQGIEARLAGTPALHEARPPTVSVARPAAGVNGDLPAQARSALGDQPPSSSTADVNAGEQKAARAS